MRPAAPRRRSAVPCPVFRTLEAARAVGVRDRRIVLRHLLPNGMGPIIVAITLGIPAAILAELECEEAQGYYFARPMEEEALRLWLVASP